MRLKQTAVKMLKGCPPLFVGASRLFHLMNREFKPGNPGAPAAIYDAFKRVKEANTDSPGDYYEFGIFKGCTFWAAQEACRKLRMDRTRFYGFDSFEGMPEISGIDKANGEFYKGQFSYSKGKVVENLSKRGVDWSRTTLIEGFYEDVLTESLKSQYPFGKVAVAFFDCDLFASTRDALKWLSPYFAEGSLVLFDDWRAYGENPELGQPKSFREFLRANSQLGADDLGPFPVNGEVFLMHVKNGGQVK